MGARFSTNRAASGAESQRGASTIAQTIEHSDAPIGRARKLEPRVCGRQRLDGGHAGAVTRHVLRKALVPADDSQKPATGGQSELGPHEVDQFPVRLRDERPVPRPTDAFHDAFARVGELREFASYYMAARLDAMKAGARKAIIWAMLGLVALVYRPR